MIVKQLAFSKEKEVAKWDTFVNKFGQLYHHSYWAKIVSSVYSFKPIYLYVENKETIVSVFPLFYVQFPFFKDELVSVPHLEACGIINTEYYSLYLDYIYQNIKPRNIKIYQFKEKINDCIANTNEVIVIIELPKSKEEIVSYIKSEPTRRNMRRALEQKYEVITEKNNEILSHFYRLYLLKMREFGTPPHGFNFIKCIQDFYKDQLIIILIKINNEYAGAGFYIQFNESLYNLYFAVPKKFLGEGVGYILEYASMSIGVERALKYIIRGRSTKGKGTYLYKMRLGGKSEQLNIYNFKLNTQGYKSQGVQTIKEKYRFGPQIWSRMPPFFTDNVGPFLRKWLY